MGLVNTIIYMKAADCVKNLRIVQKMLQNEDYLVKCIRKNEISLTQGLLQNE